MQIGQNGVFEAMPEPDALDTAPLEIGRSARTISGRLVKDSVATKKAVNMNYEALTAAGFLILNGYYETRKPVTVEYSEAGVTYSMEAFITGLTRGAYMPDTNFIKNIMLSLEEV